jgi:hypothetical protein
MDSTQTSKTHLEQLLDQNFPFIKYIFNNGYLQIKIWKKEYIQNIQNFVTFLAQNKIPIVDLDLSSNLFNIKKCK